MLGMSRCGVRLVLVGFGLLAPLGAQEPAAGATESVPPAPGSSAPKRLALLVGVADYPDGSGFDDLGGAVHDTLALRDVLIERFGFAREDVLLLHDGQATHAAIVRAFAEHLLRRAGPETEAVFFFSGHGSRVPDASGREPDDLDSTYVAFDSRSRKHHGSRDLCDDELFSLTSALCAKTPYVTVIADSCHAGGGLRARPEGRAKSVTQGAEPLDRAWVGTFWPEDVPLLDDNAPPIPPERHLHVAACRRDQVALEIPVPGPEGELVSRGLLSLCLVQALEGAQPEETWGEVLANCHLAVATANSQSVIVSGADERALFGAAFRRLEGFRASRLPDPSAIRIELTIPHGLRRESRLEIRSKELRIGEVRIDAVNAAFARGRWVGATPENIPSGTLRAVESSPPGGLPPLRVRCVPELSVLLESIGTGLIEAVPQGAPADVELVRESESVQARTTEGIPLLARPLAKDDPTLASLIGEALREELRWRFLFGLGREPSKLPVRARFRVPTREEIASRQLAWSAHEQGYVPAPLQGCARERAAGGEVFVGGIPLDGKAARPVVLLEIENPHATALHVAVLSVSEDRGRCVIRFEGDDATVELAPKGRVSLPCRVVAPETWPLERPMRDRYLVISLSEHFDPRGYERRPTLRAENGPDEADLPAPLRLGFDRAHDKPTSGSTTYGLAAVDLLVTHP